MLLFLVFACTDKQASSIKAPQTPLFPGPADANFDAELAAKADSFDRVFLAISAAPFGMSLDAYPAEHSAIEQWVAEGSGYSRAEFEDFAGQDLYSLVYHYDEMGDLGMFGGVAAVAECARYALARENSSAVVEDIEQVREHFETLLVDLHAMQAVTGRPGSLVRGLGHKDQPGMSGVEVLDFTDAEGNPQPADKHAVWREDQSGEFPELLWYDDTSKDQWDGYILALGLAALVAEGDESLDPALLEALKEDAKAMGHALMEPSSETGLDLTLIDGDGRPTTFHDLNAQELEGATSETAFNPFNALLALGGLKVLSEVSGDPEVEAFYQEVAIDRGYAELASKAGTVTWFGYATNYSNVNMVFTAVLSLLLREQDPELRGYYLQALKGLWGEGTDQAAWASKDGWYALIYGAFVEDEAASKEAIALALENLNGFHSAPWWSDVVINCDEAELSAGSCLAVDGSTTITLYSGTGRGGEIVADSYMPQSIRPPSNFQWRSNPWAVNGGGGDLLNPGGDFRAAYWLGRYLKR